MIGVGGEGRALLRGEWKWEGGGVGVWVGLEGEGRGGEEWGRVMIEIVRRSEEGRGRWLGGGGVW